MGSVRGLRGRRARARAARGPRARARPGRGRATAARTRARAARCSPSTGAAGRPRRSTRTAGARRRWSRGRRGAGTELRALQAAILAQDPALDAPPRCPRRSAGGSPVLAGRDAELESAGAGGWRSGAVVVIRGPAGIGKTRLAAELAREAVRRGSMSCTRPRPRRSPGRTGDSWSLDDADAAAAVPEAGPAALVLVLRRGEAARPPARPARPRRRRAQIAALYLTPAAAEAPADALTAATGGIPLAVHRTAAEWAHSGPRRWWPPARTRRRRTHRAARRRGRPRENVVGLQVAQERLIVDDAPPDAALCPYLGLTTFDSDHAGYFFGRERLVAELVARLVGAPLLAVVGPSGSGKSSVVRAGLLPALAGGVLPGLGELAARAHAAGRPSPPEARAPAAAGGAQRARRRPVRGALHRVPRRG